MTTHIISVIYIVLLMQKMCSLDNTRVLVHFVKKPNSSLVRSSA